MYIKNLESLRGVAALIVAIGHSLIVFSVHGNDNVWNLRISELHGIQPVVMRFLLLVFNGGAAVTLFFVLSGFVLGLSLDRNQASLSNFISFYVKRLFRIFPAHIVCLIFIATTIIIFHSYQNFEHASLWFQSWYKNKISLYNIINNVTLSSTYLNPVAWSLQIEIVMSFIIPFAHLLSRYFNFMLNLLAFTLLLWLSSLNDNLYFLYGYVFYLGLLISLVFKNICGNLTTRYGSFVFIISILVLCSSRHLLGEELKFCYILLESLASVFIILHIARYKTKTDLLDKIFNLNFIKMLGRISYSFYLFHFIILYWTSYIMFSLIEPSLLRCWSPLLFGFGLAVVSISTSIFVSNIIYTVIEKPMILLGKNFINYCETQKIIITKRHITVND